MDLAKPGEIRNHCDPNALSTFAEYLEDYGSPETRAAGNQRIDAILNSMEGGQRQRAQRLVDAVRNGRRDMYV
jgi:2-iminoacetate synthase